MTRWYIFGALLTLLLLPDGVTADIGRPGKTVAATEVTLGIYILDVDGVDTAGQSFQANVFVLASWEDARLKHKGRRAVTRKLTEIWHPRMLLLNQQRVWKSFPETAEVSPEGRVVYRQRFWGDFSQPLHLADFPFDRQVFKVHLVTAGYTPEDVRFIPHPLSGISEELSVADWEVISVRTEAEPFGISTTDLQAAGFSFSFEAKRKSGYFVVKVILPLLFIVMMSWVVFWIDPREAGSQISVAVTSMLTLIAYRFAVGADMPKLSYLTRLDYFILGSTILVFASLVEVVLTSTYAKLGRIERAQRLDRLARLVFPICFLFLAVESLLAGRAAG